MICSANTTLEKMRKRKRKSDPQIAQIHTEEEVKARGVRRTEEIDGILHSIQSVGICVICGSALLKRTSRKVVGYGEEHLREDLGSPCGT